MKKNIQKILTFIVLFIGISGFSQTKITEIQSFFKKNSTSKFSRIISFNSKSKVITIDGNRIPLNKVSFHYEYNDQYFSYAKHFVSVDCLDEFECIKSQNGIHTGILIPLNSKQNAVKFMTMLENL